MERMLPLAGRRVLLLVTGGIAAYKAPELARLLRAAGAKLRCVLTPSAKEFVTPLVMQTVTGAPVRSELFAPAEEAQISHIELADWPELIMVAPATADFIARMAQGRADSLAATLLLATRAPLLIAPAMNVNMWNHPAVQGNVELLQQRGAHVAPPESGALACGWEGQGRLPAPAALAAWAARLLGGGTLAGKRVIVTAGGTREMLDTARALTNLSSGKMGFALAAEAARRGAEVALIAAPCALPTPPGPGVQRLDVQSAQEMRRALQKELQGAGADVVVMAAAVADFRPAKKLPHKMKKEKLAADAAPTIKLARNPDLLAEISRPGAARARRTIIGFAAESEDVLAAARRKLQRKGCDLMVANDISRRDAGFNADQNAVALLTPDGATEELPLLPKALCAARIFDRIEKLHGEVQ